MKKLNEKEWYAAIALAGIVIGLSACSHNTSGFTVGTRVNAGLDPQNATANISYTDGLNVVDVARENTSWSLDVDADSGLSYDDKSGTVKGVRKIRRTVGPQITGYLVDLSEKNPEAATKYVEAMKAYWEAEAAKAKAEQESVTESKEEKTEETATAPVTEESATPETEHTEATTTETEAAQEENSNAEAAKTEQVGS